MRKFAVLCLVAVLLILSSCGHHNSSPAALTLKINPMFGASTLRLGNTYQTPWPQNDYYNFSKLKFFLSHIRLVRADASTVEVSPLAYISLDDTTTLTIKLADSIGSYTGVKFSVGLDTAQDNYDPANPTVSDPNYGLNQADMYWSSFQKYTFIKMDVGVDSTSNITQQDGLAYHVGTAPYYTAVTVNKNFSVSSGSQLAITLNADFQKIFTGTNAINPLVDHGTMTSGNNDTLAFKFMTNLSNSFSLQ